MKIVHVKFKTRFENNAYDSRLYKINCNEQEMLNFIDLERKQEDCYIICNLPNKGFCLGLIIDLTTKTNVDIVDDAEVVTIFKKKESDELDKLINFLIRGDKDES